MTEEKQPTPSLLKRIFVNKYAITLYIFAVIYIFIGNESMVNRWAKAREIRAIQEKIRIAERETDKAERMLQSLDNKDSLERYAREQYKMHEKGEVVYLVD
jgi:cell division protein FtsB